MEQHHRRRHRNVHLNLGEPPQSLSPAAEDSEESDENPEMTAPVHASKKANLNVTQELYAKLNQLRLEKEKIEDEMDALRKVIRRFEQ
jgi:hypothetical protein